MFALKNHPTCSLKVADKNLGGIWLEKSMYITRAYVDHLSDTLTYSEVETVPVQQIYKQIRRAVSRYKDSVDDVSRKYILNKVTPETCTVPTFYLLIKILKNPLSTRGIAASHSWITTGASKWISSMLNPVVKNLPSVLTSSSDLIRSLETTPLPRNCILFSWDIVALYPNIPIEMGITFVEDALNEFSDYSQDLKSLIIVLLRIVLDNSYIKFNDKRFKQIFGTAMGTSLACDFANIFVFYFFRPIWVKFKDHFLFSFSYIDDIAGAIHNREHFQKFFDAIITQVNKKHPRIKITVVVSDTSIDALDITFFKGSRFHNSGILDIKPYRKKQSRFLYPIYSSFHAPGSKTSWLVAELMRLVRNSSHLSYFLAEKRFFAEKTRLRGIPPSVFDLHASKVSYADRAKYLTPVVRSNDNNNLPLFFQTTYTPLTRFLNIKKILSSCWGLLPPSIYGEDVCKLVTTYKRGKNLREILSPSAML